MNGMAIMNPKLSVRILIFLAVLLSVVPVSAQSLTPPADMFQLPWEQGRAWVAYSGLDNGTKRPTTSPHYYGLGGAIDFAPRVNMVRGEDTSNDWVAAIGAGTVTQVGYCWVKIDHGNGWTSEYWHLGNIQVSQGQKVSRNQRLAVIHNNATEQVCAGNEYPGPHLHFVFRPSVTSTLFAGWKVNFNSFTNVTTFTKSGQTVGLLQPLMNIPDLQIVSRGPLAWDTQYSGSVDAYRHDRWSLLLTEQTTFHINVSPASVGLTPVIVLLDGNGVEISRGYGTLTSTQPAGSYFVQIQSESGTGYYNLIATRDGAGATATPIMTSTPDGSVTPIMSATPTGSETPIVSVTPPGSETPVDTPTLGTGAPTWTPIATDITSTSETPIITNTPVTVTPIVTSTPLATETAIPTPTGAYVWTDVLQSTLTIGESSLVTVGLYNVPVEGYASAEFTCTYYPAIAQVSNILVSGLFGPDPVSAMSGPQNGQFVLAVAGGSGNRAMSNGTAFTFMVNGLQAGQTPVQCTARVSTGVGGLEPIAYIADTLNVVEVLPTPTGVAPLSAIVNGQVLASKTVTIQLFDVGNQLVVSQSANPDGTFALPALGGNYTIVASASGFLNAQASITLTAGVITTMPTISLLAGDVDGNGVIDEFDALTLGMSYGASTPAAADLNSDGVIDFLDLELLAENYRASGALAW
jgi:hypothetical protein